MSDNLKYNRIETEIDRIYFNRYVSNFDKSFLNEGMVKCKLIHSENESLIFPDFLILKKDDGFFYWIQPLNYFCNILIKDDSIILCSFYVDISYGKTLRIEFSNSDLIRNFNDNSSLFKCNIYGCDNLLDYATGEAIFFNEIPFLKLYHHTSEESKKLILESGFLKPSYWNIQGNKKLKNIGYFYLTPLNKIEKPEDLKQIAMATDGKMHFIIDNYEPSLLRFENDENILELEVYRESTLNRNNTLSFYVDSTILSPKHLWKHSPNNNFVFFEIGSPLIQRIGIEVGKTLNFEKNIIFKQENVKIFDLMVVGDATKIEGLKAPFDEENTSYNFKINTLLKDTNILDFWFQNANSIIYPNIQTDSQEFE